MIFPFIPEPDVLESIEWFTNIIESFNGDEQRIRLRTSPRHSYECKYLFSNQNGGSSFRIKSFLASQQASIIQLPLWHDFSYFSADAGDIVLSGDFNYCDYQGFAVLWVNEWIYELIEIESITGTEITATESIINNYPVGSIIMPVRDVRMEDSIAVKDSNRNLVGVDVMWKCKDNYSIAGIDLTQYKGYDVVEYASLSSSNMLQREIRRDKEWIDFDTGVVSTFSRLDYSKLNTGAINNTLNSKQDIYEFRRWAHKLKGGVEPFWLPTFSQDIKITQNFLSNANLITIERIDYILSYQSPMFKNLCFVQDKNTFIFKEVSDCAVVGYEEIVTLNTPFGFAGGANTFYCICFMPLVRLASDRVEIQWRRSDLANISFAVSGVLKEII